MDEEDSPEEKALKDHVWERYLREKGGLNKEKRIEKATSDAYSRQPEPKTPPKQPTGAMSKTMAMLIAASAAGLLLIIASFFYAKNNDLMLAMFILGSLLFLPIGLLIGGLMMDKYLRCRAMRLLCGKNYAVFNLVTRDGRSMVTFIKDLANATIERGDQKWFIIGNRIFSDKGETEGAELTPESIKFISGVPVVYLSYESLLPLTFNKADTVNPEEVNAAQKAWIITKEAELLKWKQTAKIAGIIILALCAVSAYFGYMVYDTMNTKVAPQVTEIRDKIIPPAPTASPSPATGVAIKPNVAKQAGASEVLLWHLPSAANL